MPCLINDNDDVEFNIYNTTIDEIVFVNEIFVRLNASSNDGVHSFSIIDESDDLKFILKNVYSDKNIIDTSLKNVFNTLGFYTFSSISIDMFSKIKISNTYDKDDEYDNQIDPVYSGTNIVQKEEYIYYYDPKFDRSEEPYFHFQKNDKFTNKFYKYFDEYQSILHSYRDYVA